MTLTLLNTWVELQDIDCPPHLRSKRIIDRRGIETHRCITPPDSDVEVYSVPSIMYQNKEDSFTAEFRNPNLNYEEDSVNNSVFNKTRDLLETSNLPDIIKERLSSLWDRYPDSYELDRPIENRELIEWHSHLQNKEKDLDGMLFEIANSVELRKVLMGSSAIGFVNSWHSSATHSRSRKFNEIVFYLKNGEFSTPAYSNSSKNEMIEESKDIQNMMDTEQKIWRDIIGDGTIRVYRGVNISKENLPDIGKTEAIDNTLSSWSLSPNLAGSFGNIVLARTISVDDIVASFFSLNFTGEGGNEGELILHTSEEGVDVDVISREHPIR